MTNKQINFQFPIIIGLFVYLLIGFLLHLNSNKAYANLTPTLEPAKALTGTSAAVASPSATPNVALDQNLLNNLTQRIASQVAAMKLVEKRGIIGTVTDVTDTQLKLNDLSGNIRFVDIDELTQFSSPSAKAGFGISDITRGSTISVLGIYNKESKRILARFINVVTVFHVLSGAVTAIDGDNYTITVTTPEQKDVLVTIQDITRTYQYTKAGGITRSGFSKIKQGERVMVAGTWDTQNMRKLLATRIFRLIEIPVNPKIVRFKPGELQLISPTQSTGSGVKLTPVKK